MTYKAVEHPDVCLSFVHLVKLRWQLLLHSSVCSPCRSRGIWTDSIDVTRKVRQQDSTLTTSGNNL